jgi:hypothetical protein
MRFDKKKYRPASEAVRKETEQVRNVQRVNKWRLKYHNCIHFEVRHG